VLAEHGAHIPPRRLQEALWRVLAAAEPMRFPGAAPAATPALERAWWREIVRRTLRAADSAEAARVVDFEACFERLYHHFAAAAAWRARPGAATALDALRARGLATGVVSNFDGRLRGILAGLGLAARLDVVVLPSEAGAAKPDPAIFALALRRLAVAAADCVYVGDDPVDDLEAARRAGLRAVDVASLATLDELPALLLGPEACPQESKS